MEELYNLTVQWSHDIGILTNGKISTQMLKLVSEVGELSTSLLYDKSVADDLGDCMVLITNISYMAKVDKVLLLYPQLVEPSTHPFEQYLRLVETIGEMADAVAKEKNLAPHIALVLGQLNTMASGFDYTLKECWAIAYNDIKDRKGFLNTSGNFIKDTDPSYTQLLMEFEQDLSPTISKIHSEFIIETRSYKVVLYTTDSDNKTIWCAKFNFRPSDININVLDLLNGSIGKTRDQVIETIEQYGEVK